MHNHHRHIVGPNHFQNTLSQTSVNSKNNPIVAEIGPSSIESSTFQSTRYESVTELIKDDQCSEIVVWSREPDYEEMLLLRQDQRYRYRLIFSLNSIIQNNSSTLLDQQCKPEQWIGLWEQWRNRLWQHPHYDSELVGRNALLLYLRLNPSRKLSPSIDITSSQIYEHPLLRLFYEKNQDDRSELEQLFHEKLITQDGPLVDRIRLCRSCHHAHLNFIETCPHCSAIDIVTERSIHCFACGHVANQDCFVQDNQMSCPNCLTRLLHIGVDYDYPLENLRCNSCKTFFVEGNVMARCFSCQHEQLPGELLIDRVMQYRITEKGQQIALGVKQNSDSLKLGDSIDLNHFYWQADWCLKLSERYNIPFVFFALRFTGLDEISEKLGQTSLSNLMTTMEQRLKAEFRPTDLISRFDRDGFLLLLPRIEENSLVALRKKIDSIMVLIDLPGDAKLSVRINHTFIPDHTNLKVDSKTLVTRLIGN